VAKGGTAEAFLEALWLAEETLGEQCVRLDKKREKAALATARASLRAQLQAATQVEVALHLAVLLLELDLHAAFFQVPGKLLPLLLAHLQPKLPDGAHATLTEAHAAVGAALKGQTEAQFDIEALRALGLNKGHAATDAE